jgi:hypothetical membrane protein
MRFPAALQTFSRRYPKLGPFILVLSLQYYVVQLIVGLSTKSPYSLLHNTISDLGNTVCGVYSNHQVCSPLHPLMNISFVVLGLSMIIGSTLVYAQYKQARQLLAIGFGFMALSGLGSIFVGLFPENTIASMHILGASLSFILGNLALLLFGLTLSAVRSIKVYAALSGVVAIIALGLFYSQHYINLGIGGTERITDYPQTIWLSVFGLYELVKAKGTREGKR